MANVPLLDIRPDHWALVRAILYAHVPQYEVWAFGSRATWQAKPYSDLDLAILSAEPLPLALSAALADAFSEADLPWRVDVLDWATTSPSFRAIVQRDKVVVQQKSINVKSSWRRYQVSDLINDKVLVINDGYRAKNSELLTQGLPFARAGNINDGFNFRDADCFPVEHIARIGNKVSQPGDVVFTSKGTVGRFAFVKLETPTFVYSPQLCFWRSLKHDLVHPKFLYYWMLGREFFAQFKSVSGQTDMAEFVSLTDQRRMYITLPPLPIQHAIAHILGSLDDKIELNRRMNETLDAMARALFKDWFVEFGPVRAKMEGRQPPGLSAEIAALFPDALDTEGKPVGWSVSTFQDLALLNPESWSVKSIPEVIEYIDLANTKWGTIEKSVQLSWQDAPSRAQRILRIGDTIVGTVRPGNGSYAYISVDGLTGSTGFAVLRPKRVEYREFIYLAVTDRENIERLSHLADGGAYPAVRSDVVLNSPITIPTDELISIFSGITSLWVRAIENNKNESRTLAALRDLLLPKLLSGELRVRDAEGVITGAR